MLGKNATDITGQRFGRLIVICPLHRKHYRSSGGVAWLCSCDCGTVKKVDGNNLRSKRVTSCGCKAIERMSGPKNPAWKGGITKEHQKIRTRSNYLAWRNSVYERDNHTCRKCNVRGGKLAAHHLFNFSEHPNLRTTLTNGVTLCWRCHLDFHNLYGRSENTGKQFYAWIN